MTTKKRPPNILLVVTDDQPLRTMGAISRMRRWLRRNGTRYPNAYATTPVCCPSRASILTGKYAHNHGVTKNGQAKRLDMGSTIQRALQDNGYETGVFGKFLNGWDLAADPPYFDRWAVIPRSRDAYRGGVWNVQGNATRVHTYGTTFVGRSAARFIQGTERSDGEPWFAYLAPPAPHYPFTPEQRYEDRQFAEWNGDPSNFERDRGDKPRYVRRSHVDLAFGRQLRTNQMRSLLSVDDMMGNLREVLTDTKEASNTVVIFISDNGYLWGQHGITGKFVPYVESVRIPALIRWPRGTDRPRVDDRLVANIDLAPTIADLAGITPGREFAPDGRSLLDGGWTRRRLLIEAWAERDLVPAWAGLISKTRSFVEYYGDDLERLVFREFYRLRRDPHQMTNLMRDGDPRTGPSNVDRMSSTLARKRACSGPESCP